MEVDLIIWILQITVLVQAEVCEKLTACSCKTSSGVVDLSALPSSIQVTDPQKYLNVWSPCTGVKCTAKERSAVSVCQTSPSKPPSSYVNGYLNTARFTGDPDNNQLVLSYTGDTDPTVKLQRKTSIKLICDVDMEENRLIADGETKLGSVDYRFTLQSRHACVISSALSPGSVLLIIFFVLVILYIVGGVLFLRFYRGASGVEMIPNFEFWKDFPFLVKDGMVFTFRGCKADTTYTQI